MRPSERARAARLMSAEPRSISETIALPLVVDRPSPRPSNLITGSIPKPKASVRRQTRTTARVRIRARPRTDADVLTTLEAGRSLSELARSGVWRLVSADGVAGWVHGDYLAGAKSAAATEPAGARQGRGEAQGRGRNQKALKVSVVRDLTIPGTLAMFSLMNLPMSCSAST